MKQIRILAVSIFVGLGLLAPTAMMLVPSSAFATGHTSPVAEGCTDAKSCTQQGVCVIDPASCIGDPSTKVNSTVKTVINILSVVVGIVSVIMIILAGLKFCNF